MTKDSELFEAIQFVARKIESGDTSGGLPLCGQCGGAHEGECPQVKCPLCDTTHKRNKPFYYNNCEHNERWKKWYKGHLEWVEENTRQIRAQKDTKNDEEE